MGFPHLQIRSGYSFYESSVQFAPLVKRAKQLGFSALSLTDAAVLYAAISFYNYCPSHGIKPIFGLTLTIEHHHNKIDCVVIAKSNEGYRQLIKISTKIQTDEINSFENLFTKTDKLVYIV